MGRRNPLLVELSNLSVPGRLDAMQRADAARRLATLLIIDTAESRRGGIGRITQVYNCLGEEMCLKSIAPSSRQRAHSVERDRSWRAKTRLFWEEFLCQCAIRSAPGMPRPLGYGSFEGGPVMLMEWMRATPVSVLAGRLDPLGCAVLGTRVASLLLCGRACDGSFVHRDLSGRNICLLLDVPIERQMAARDFRPVLLDFGSSLCSRVREEADASGRIVWRNATPAYAPPEMLTTKEAGLLPLRALEQVDVYELCAVLYELRYGRTPHAGTSQRGARRVKLTQPVVVPTPTDEVDALLADTLLWGLAPASSRRPKLKALFGALVATIRLGDPVLAERVASEHADALGACAVGEEQGFTQVL